MGGRSLSPFNHFVTDLEVSAPLPVDPEMGKGIFTLNADLTALNFHIRVNTLSLTGPITAAHFHNAPAGQTGDLVRTFTQDFVGGTADGIATGTWTAGDAEPLTPRLVREILAGNIYVDIHTAAHPAGQGEVYGQVLRGVLFSGPIDGGQEVPPLDLPGQGFSHFAFNPNKMELAYLIHVDTNSLTGPIAAAHFHNAAEGENGGIVRHITRDFVDGTAVGVWRATDALSFSDDMIAELMAGNLYINVHTTAYPGGEIRGQVLPPMPRFGAHLDAGQQNPPLDLPGMGFAEFSFNPILGELDYDINVDLGSLTGPIIAAHFHSGPPGQNGSLERGFTFSGDNASGTWTPDDAQPLTLALVRELFSGNLYINVVGCQRNWTLLRPRKPKRLGVVEAPSEG